MKLALKSAAIVFFLVLITAVVQAEEFAKDFTFTALDGRTFDYASMKGLPLVVNIGSHW